MKYNIELEHDDFVLILSILKNAEEQGMIAWDAASFLCTKTKVNVK